MSASIIDYQSASREAAQWAQILGLPLNRRRWRGRSGTIGGQGCGSSVEFHDHRDYHLGDDLRHLDWAAFARTDRAVLKVFREEVSPQVDVIVDHSLSMHASANKSQCSASLMLWACEAARRSGAHVRLWLADANSARRLDDAELAALQFPPPAGCPGAPRLEALPLGAASLRVLISDLLWPEGPAALHWLAREGGQLIVMSPFEKAESDPDWEGDLQLLEAESAVRHRRHVDQATLRRYRDAYLRHFADFNAQIERFGGQLLRIGAEDPRQSLMGDGLSSGALELRR